MSAFHQRRVCDGDGKVSRKAFLGGLGDPNVAPSSVKPPDILLHKAR